VPVNRWLDGLPNWQFAAVIAGLCSLTGTVEAVLMTLAMGHLDLGFAVLYWCVSIPTLCTCGLLARRSRHRHARQ
jgi:hypothetical protein